jgi:hypothetical protein
MSIVDFWVMRPCGLVDVSGVSSFIVDDVDSVLYGNVGNFYRTIRSHNLEDRDMNNFTNCFVWV